MNARLPALILLTDRHIHRDPAAALASLRAGDMVIVRDYDHPSRAAYARMWRQFCGVRRLRLVIAGDAGLAFRLAAGLHLPGWYAPHVRPAFRGQGKTTSFHHARETRRLLGLRPNAAFASPVFATPSHPDARVLGAIGFRRLQRGLSCTLAALGGVNHQTVRFLPCAPVAGIRLSTPSGERPAV